MKVVLKRKILHCQACKKLLQIEKMFKHWTLIFNLKKLYINTVTLVCKNLFFSAPRSGLAAKFGIDVGGIFQTLYTTFFL
jgi:hypothetical protein